LLTDDRSGEQPTKQTGSIILRDQVEWEARWWVYDFILEFLAASVVESDKTLAMSLLASRTMVAEHECNLVSVDSRAFHRFTEAMTNLYARWVESRAHVGQAPEYEAELLPRVATLHRLFQSDPRNRK